MNNIYYSHIMTNYGLAGGDESTLKIKRYDAMINGDMAFIPFVLRALLHIAAIAFVNFQYRYPLSGKKYQFFFFFFDPS